MHSDVAIDQAQVTLFFWTAAITLFFQAFEAIRQADRKWAIGYFVASLVFFALGFVWESLPSTFAGLLAASADQVYGLGVLVISIAYAYARKRWVKYGDKSIVAGLGEGIVVVSFVTLMIGPILDAQLFASIVAKFQTQFLIAGGVGLVLVYQAHRRAEESGERLATLQSFVDDVKKASK